MCLHRLSTAPLKGRVFMGLGVLMALGASLGMGCGTDGKSEPGDGADDPYDVPDGITDWPIDNPDTPPGDLDTDTGTDTPTDTPTDRPDLNFEDPADEEQEAEEPLPPGTCMRDFDCGQVGVYCERSGEGYGVCRRQAITCEPCGSPNQCESQTCLQYPGYAEKRCGFRSCAEDAECQAPPLGNANWRCDGTFCFFTKPNPVSARSGPCCDNADCEVGLVCNPTTLKCTVGCAADAECGPGRVCANGTCRTGCNTSAECPAGTACDPEEKRCLQGQCIRAQDCPPEHVCNRVPGSGVGGSCVSGCKDNFDCLGQNECKFKDPATGIGRCVVRTGCDDTGQCRLGFWCDKTRPDADNPERGTCVKMPVENATCCECSQDSDCGQDSYCAEIDPAKCEKDADCGTPPPDANNRCDTAAQTCILEGRATERSCGTDEDCGLSGPNQRCDTAAQKCIRGGELDTRKAYKVCIIPYDCKRRDDQGNDVGQFDCPRGLTCSTLNIQQQGGGSQQKGFCFIDCNRMCAWSTRYEQSTCSAARPFVCCDQGQPAGVCRSTN